MQDVTTRILKFNKDFDPHLSLLKYQLMGEHAFRFFRGTCHLYYEDLSKSLPLPSSPVSWLCGDLHIENFGSYKGDNGLVYFDINDFDESILGPLLWDVARITTSIFLAFDALHINEQEAVKALKIFYKHFTGVLINGKARYIEPQTACGIVKTFLQSVADRKESVLLKERTIKKQGKLLLNKGIKKHLRIPKEKKNALIANFNIWMKSSHVPPNNYQVTDVCFRIAGTGSVGVDRYLFLIEKINAPGKYKLIDMKQALPSSLKPYITIPQPIWKSEAERLASVQQRMQSTSPAQLSENIFGGLSFLMQELQPTKDRINYEVIKDFKEVSSVMEDMGLIAASAYLRSSGRQGSCTADELIAFGINPNWQESVIAYSKTYVEKVKSDYAAFKKDLPEIELMNKIAG